MASSSSSSSIFLLCLTFIGLCSAMEVSYDANALIIDGERRLIFSGAVHFPRSTVEMWPNIIQKAKEGGLDAIETYIFWDHHEPVRRKYDFSGNLDFVKFFKLIGQAGLYGILRIGPYVCAEWSYGGFPLWLHKMPGIELRTDNQVYKDEMQIFTSKIVNMSKEAKLFASQGGPIILAQIENEYGNIMSGYGDAGKAYVKWCAQMALAQNIGVPWIMCQQDDAPDGIINTCNGYYCDDFQPNNPKSPKVFTENWLGWFQKWGERKPHRSSEDVAFAVARFFQKGGVLNNYYMYHGGTNFGRTAGGPYITTSYDYDAPIDEYGNLNQPKWGHLKQLHAAIKLGEKILTNGTRIDKDFGNLVTLTTYTNNATGGRFCFLSNGNESQDASIDLQDGNDKYFVPAWSVTILGNCSKEVFNTAKVNTQTSVMVKKSDNDASSAQLTWAWRPEAMEDTLKGYGKFKANQLLEQKDLTLDVSDYLWYMTTVNINDTSTWQNATLRVETMGHVLHSFINQNFVGSNFSQSGGNFTFKIPISLKLGTNIITLLSATVGLPNYGAKFDLIKTGIADGPIQLIGKNNVTIDLSKSSWSYKIGLNGEAERLYDQSWNTNPANNPPIGRRMTWYKAKFNMTSGTNPVVVDLQGMGKGQAWVNGKSIGRYWPSLIASPDGCSEKCDYRGAYKAEKCNYNCGNPSQRWYHVPRSFLNNQESTLVLFEEIGGNPQNVSLQTVTIGAICAYAYEGALLELSCQGGQTMSEIQFASFGDPQGSCGSFQKGSLEANNSKSIVEAACIGKESCRVSVTREAFSISSTANTTTSKLAVQVKC